MSVEDNLGQIYSGNPSVVETHFQNNLDSLKIDSEVLEKHRNEYDNLLKEDRARYEEGFIEDTNNDLRSNHPWVSRIPVLPGESIYARLCRFLRSYFSTNVSKQEFVCAPKTEAFKRMVEVGDEINRSVDALQNILDAISPLGKQKSDISNKILNLENSLATTKEELADLDKEIATLTSFIGKLSSYLRMSSEEKARFSEDLKKDYNLTLNTDKATLTFLDWIKESLFALNETKENNILNLDALALQKETFELTLKALEESSQRFWDNYPVARQNIMKLKAVYSTLECIVPVAALELDLTDTLINAPALCEAAKNSLITLQSLVDAKYELARDSIRESIDADHFSDTKQLPNEGEECLTLELSKDL